MEWWKYALVYHAIAVPMFMLFACWCTRDISAATRCNRGRREVRLSADPGEI